MTEEQDKIKERVLSSSISISRIPISIKQSFVEFAREEYCNDYGMAFKRICDTFFDNTMESKLAKLEARIEKLEEE